MIKSSIKIPNHINLIQFGIEIIKLLSISEPHKKPLYQTCNMEIISLIYGVDHVREAQFRDNILGHLILAYLLKLLKWSKSLSSSMLSNPTIVCKKNYRLNDKLICLGIKIL